MKKILFASCHSRDRVPGQRYRFEQYIDYLAEHGFVTEFSSILDDSDYEAFYGEGNYLSKAYIISRGIGRRILDLLRGSHYDIIFIQREVLPLGTTLFEKTFRRMGSKLVFDFDDAIWIRDVSQGNRRLAWLKNVEKTAKLISISDTVFAGNQYLYQYASQYNQNVKIIPTTIDTDSYVRHPLEKLDGRVCIGWTGSSTTLKHFELAIPFLKEIRSKYGGRVYFKVIGSSVYHCSELGIRGSAWHGESEISDLSEIDIGIMPLPDDEWAKGKCGLKGLQYMALEIPTVLSPVGVNKEIIEDGKNGFLASTPTEWVEKLSHLIDSGSLRTSFGKAARQTVVERYSVESQKQNYLNCLNELS